MSSRGKKAASSTLDHLVNLCKRRGFVFPGSDLYGSIGTSYDFGPLGAQLKKNLADAWWRDFVTRRRDCMPLETGILLNPKVWQASGHVDEFTDPLSECRSCHRRVRADNVMEDAVGEEVAKAIGASLESLAAALVDHNVPCPHCGATGDSGLGPPRDVNLLFTTHVGTDDPASDDNNNNDDDDGSSGLAYLRPETAQGAYIHFHNIINSMRGRLPLGVAQAGKSFRNEIRASHFGFRSREFDQLELQFYCHPSSSSDWQHHWVEFCHDWLLNTVKLRPENVRLNEFFGPDELAHYALATTDIEFRFPFGWGELWGVANRGSYDLEKHSKAAGVELSFRDPVSNEQYMPHVIEPSLGGGRLLLAVLSDAYREESVPDAKGGTSSRVVLKLAEELAPYRAAVLPLTKKGPLMECAADVQARLLATDAAPSIDFDVTGSIGKRYRRQDEIGTPFCVTVDYDTLDDNAVTVRCRDSMQQVRVGIDALVNTPLRRRNLFDDDDGNDES